MRRLVMILTILFVLVSGSSALAVTLKIATAVPEGSYWMNQMRAGAKEIKERTQGRVSIKFYGGGVMGNDKSVLRKIRVGQLHGGAFTAGGLSAVYADLKLYSLPFLFRSAEEVRTVREKIDPILKKGLLEKGFVSFGFAGGGFANLMSSSLLRGMDDVRERKVWVPEGDIVSYAVLESLNVSPVSLNMIDVMTGLQTGLLDIVVATPTAALAFQWHTKIRYVVDTPLVYVVAVLALDRRVYSRIKPEDQLVVDEVMSRIYREFNQQGAADNGLAIEAMKKQGIEFVTIDSADIETWRKDAISVELRLADEGIYSKTVFELLLGCLNECRAEWSGAQ
ncbi:TRAP transporter substrate-binding protein DctP [uncultured Pseudodesulfovibrio sp.]|uniref:TRAP transporter substrate-binding protein n=1 Tax=uncultured Pseudodesulfovibrio sp. TaxID=2035858 RepID=UPI0029C6F997|nr:TRAP transporter substrate-binding protein DctP [uncultured Pseudodesulfovibrio sp.]